MQAVIPPATIRWKRKTALRRHFKRMVGHVEVNDPSPVMTQHDEHVQNPESNRRHGEEVASNDVRNVICQECSPRLRRQLSGTDQVLGYGSFRSLVAQQEQFRQNAGRAPKWVFSGHATNQVPEFARDERPARFSSSRLPSPVELESLPVPFGDRFAPGRWPTRIASSTRVGRARPRRSGHASLAWGA